MAIEAAAEGSRTLIVSTDPAHSLGDAVGIRLGRRPRRLPIRRGTLHAVEVDAAAVIRDWLSTHSSMLEDIALRGTWLDADDVNELIGLTLPGIDELAGLLELARFGRSGRYDLIVVDTAPTGHTLRMLAMPDALARVAEVFDAMQDKHRAIVAALRGRWEPDAADDFVGSLAADARELGALVRDSDCTAVTWVSLAERMAVEETLDGLRVLVKEQVPVETIVPIASFPAMVRVPVLRRATAPPGRLGRFARPPATVGRRAVAPRQSDVGLPGRTDRDPRVYPDGVGSCAASAGRVRPAWAWPCEERRLVTVGSGPGTTVGRGPDGIDVVRGEGRRRE